MTPREEELTDNVRMLRETLVFITEAIHDDKWDEMGALLDAIDKRALDALESTK